MKSSTVYVLLFVLIPIFLFGADEKQVDVKAPRVNLQVAVIQGNLKAVQQHIAAGSDLNEKEPDGGSTPLITAATFGKTDVVNALLDAGAELNLKNNDGSTALITAAFFCHEDIVKALLNAGADKTLTNNYGSTALQTVQAPYENVKPIYEQIETALSPLGFRLDYAHLEKTRPRIAEVLQ